MSVNAQAAPALIASNLLAVDKAHNSTRPAPASSGSAALDELALSGGFRYGEITSIAGATGTGKTLLVYHAIVSHLLAFPFGEAAFIDTTGSFSPLRLRDVLLFRLEAKRQRQSYQQSGYIYDKAQPEDREAKQAIVKEATTMLDRVKVMRVFDFAGVTEAVAEVGEMRDTIPQGAGKAVKRIRDEVGDSEEELDDDGVPADPLSGDVSRISEPGEIGVIVIDSITNVVSSLVSKSQTQGQGLLASFMRSLLTSSNNPEYKRRPEDNVSVFSSTLGKPALGKTFTHLIDTSIFLSLIPKTTDDAETAYSDSGNKASFGKAHVLEVLKDRCGTREGQWAAFEIVDEVKIIPCLR